MPIIDKLVKTMVNCPIPCGGVAERSIAAVLKTVVLKGTGGSNPSPSASFFVSSGIGGL